MVVQNNGQATVVLDPNPANTRLIFTVDGQNRSAEYAVTGPIEFTTGNDSLPGDGTTGSLEFTITTTGTTSGQMNLGGVFTGTDANSGAVVSDNTADGGSANMAVQERGALEIAAIRTSQPSVTVGQTAPWQAVVRVVNTGRGGRAAHVYV